MIVSTFLCILCAWFCNTFLYKPPASVVFGWEHFPEPGLMQLNSLLVQDILTHADTVLPLKARKNLKAKGVDPRLIKLWTAQIYVHSQWTYATGNSAYRDNVTTYNPVTGEYQFRGACTEFAKTMATVGRSLGLSMRITVTLPQKKGQKAGHAFAEVDMGQKWDDVIHQWDLFSTEVTTKDMYRGPFQGTVQQWATVKQRGAFEYARVRMDLNSHYWMPLENNGLAGFYSGDLNWTNCKMWVSESNGGKHPRRENAILQRLDAQCELILFSTTINTKRMKQTHNTGG